MFKHTMSQRQYIYVPSSFLSVLCYGTKMWLIFLWTFISYLILAPTAMTNEKDPKVSAKICFDAIGLDPELYRIGHTKASWNTLSWILTCFPRLDFVFFEVFLWTPFPLGFENFSALKSIYSAPYVLWWTPHFHSTMKNHLKPIWH